MSSSCSSVVSLADSVSIRSSSASTDPSLFSSGLTTPADECSQPFDDVGVHNTTLDPEAEINYGEIATPKPLFSSKGFRQATKFAQRLVTPKKMRIKSMASPLSTPKRDSSVPVNGAPGPFAMHRSIDRAKRIFSLPNRHLRPLKRPSVLAVLHAECPSPSFYFGEGIIPGQNTPVINDIDHVSTSEGQSMLVDEPVTPSPASPAPQYFSLISFLIITAKVICFLPWCIAVGATLSLAPQYSDLVAFQTGYVASLQGVRRFAYWAECGLQQVAIFTASVIIVCYFKMSLGITLAAVAFSRFIYVWQDFKFDQSIPLGQDDRQSLYRVAVMDNYGLDKNTIILMESEGEVYRSVVIGEDTTTPF